MTRVFEHRIAGHRIVLREGVEASIRIPGRSNRIRSRFLYADSDTGDVTFSVRGKTRTVKPDAVDEVHHTRKLRAETMRDTQ